MVLVFQPAPDVLSIREGKGRQGWITYHPPGNERVQVGIRNRKAAKDFGQFN
jgi:hypothetical protein